MSLSIYPILRQLLFLLPAELSHELTLAGLKQLGRYRWSRSLLRQNIGEVAASAPIELMGLQLPNRVGLAAGLDKQGSAAAAFHALGFGFVECGTVTPLPQAGNPKPRLFRLKDEKAIINRMGFNSIGMAQFVKNIERYLADVPSSERGVLGINIGKNATTPIDKATDDYLSGFQRAYPLADYISVNISSPNTKNLRDLQGEAAMRDLLHALCAERVRLADQLGVKKPIALKVAPDLSEAEIDSIAKVVCELNVDGLIATNTTVSRPPTAQDSGGIKSNSLNPSSNKQRLFAEAGGLSGRPLQSLSSEVVEQFARRIDGQLPIIAAGGIDSGKAALEKIQAGASAVQIYTGLIYRGPALIRELVQALE